MQLSGPFTSLRNHEIMQSQSIVRPKTQPAEAYTRQEHVHRYETRESLHTPIHIIPIFLSHSFARAHAGPMSFLGSVQFFKEDELEIWI
jgi:hypothetical protein